MKIVDLLTKEFDDKYLKSICFLLLFAAQILLLMLNVSAIPREQETYWFVLYIGWIEKSRYAYITFVIIVLLWTISYIFLRKISKTFIFMEIITFLFGYANKMRYMYMMKYLSIQDLGLLSEVKDVRIDYAKGVSMFCILLLVGAGVVLGLSILFEKRFSIVEKKKITWKNIMVAGIFAACIVFGVRTLQLKDNYRLNFGLLSENELGAVLVGLESFFAGQEEAPNEEKAREFVQECREYLFEHEILSEQGKEEMKTPTIVVIMSESFWDMDHLLDVVSIDENPMRRYHEIAGNCIRGEIAVNVFGGVL
ncbi:MAG: hypothetical protein NC086_11020 [Alistipes sp.]|nr:hypothetical protein [Alistipes sp.]